MDTGGGTDPGGDAKGSVRMWNMVPVAGDMIERTEGDRADMGGSCMRWPQVHANTGAPGGGSRCWRQAGQATMMPADAPGGGPNAPPAAGGVGAGAGIGADAGMYMPGADMNTPG